MDQRLSLPNAAPPRATLCHTCLTLLCEGTVPLAATLSCKLASSTAQKGHQATAPCEALHDNGRHLIGGGHVLYADSGTPRGRGHPGAPLRVPFPPPDALSHKGAGRALRACDCNCNCYCLRKPAQGNSQYTWCQSRPSAAAHNIPSQYRIPSPARNLYPTGKGRMLLGRATRYIQGHMA